MIRSVIARYIFKVMTDMLFEEQKYIFIMREQKMFRKITPNTEALSFPFSKAKLESQWPPKIKSH